MDYSEFIRSAAGVRPSARQLAWFQNPFYAFVHFGVNTFTGREWGNGTEDPAIFNPEKLDCDQWVEAIKSAGMTGMILTCKHHDGFCLWPSKYTEHSVKNSPFRGGKGDVVKEASEACRRGGIKFGMYLSPWDRNSKFYGTPEYNDYYKAELTELLTQYGEIFHFWFDGACGEGPNGRKQQYDFPGYIELIRKYQPNATIFYDHGPDVRWIGNEAGAVRSEEWAVVPNELTYFAEQQTKNPDAHGTLQSIEPMWSTLGQRYIIEQSKGLSFCPAEADMSIRKGWFYHPEEEPHSLERLYRTYLNTVGGNAGFSLNVPPTKDGLFDERDVKRLGELGAKLRGEFSHNVSAQAEIEEAASGRYRITLPRKTALNHIVLRENIAEGQAVESFVITKRNEFGGDDYIFQGTTIGGRRICSFEPTETQKLEVRILASRKPVHDLSISLFSV